MQRNVVDNRYDVVQPLGSGGMGEVYLGKTEGIAGIEKRCVVKTLRASFAADREHVARFIDEARVVVQLQHRNVCAVFDVGAIEDRYYLAMEHVGGRDQVERALVRGQPLEQIGQVQRGVDAPPPRLREHAWREVEAF